METITNSDTCDLIYDKVGSTKRYYKSTWLTVTTHIHRKEKERRRKKSIEVKSNTTLPEPFDFFSRRL